MMKWRELLKITRYLNRVGMVLMLVRRRKEYKQN